MLTAASKNVAVWLSLVLVSLLLPALCAAQGKVVTGRKDQRAPDTKNTSVVGSNLVEANLPGNAFSGVVPGPDGRLFGVTYEGGMFDSGTIYSVDPALSSVTIVHHFKEATDGSSPFDELVLNNNGKFYGTTSRGGPTNVGTVFEFDPGNNAFVTLRSDFGGFAQPQGPLVTFGGYLFGSLGRPNGAVFRMATDGSDFEVIHAFSDFSALPQPLTLGPDQKLYGVTSFGGDICGLAGTMLGCGTVFRLKPVLPGDTDVQFQVLHRFQTAFHPARNLIYSSDNKLYGTTPNGIFRLDSGGSTPQFIFMNGGGFLSIIEGSNGKLFVADYSGGTAGAGRIFSINKDGTGDLTLHTFSYSSGSNGPYGRLYLAGELIYGTTEYSDGSSPGTVFRFSSTGVEPPKLKVAGGNILIGSPGNGIILRSPDSAACKLLSIDNNGALVVSSLACP